MKRSLTPMRKQFVDEYLIDLNATRAASSAGYKHPNVQGSQLLAIPGVKTQIQTELQLRKRRLRRDADWVVERLESEAIDPKNTASVRVKALELLGKHLGIFARENDKPANTDEFIFVDL